MTNRSCRAALLACAWLLANAACLADTPPNARPYLGWSSWSLEATKYPGYDGEAWLTAAHVEAQSNALHRLLQKHGYLYINIDSGWKGGYDAFGRPVADLRKFPKGIAGIAHTIHRNGQRLGIYYYPGMDEGEYRRNPPILGTPYHLQDIAALPLRPANGWGGGYKIDFSKPGAQEYMDSIAAEFAAWKIDFLKFDGVTPGSDRHDAIDARPDVRALSLALKRTGRPIWLTLSWRIDLRDHDFWREYAQAWRISDDVEIYGKTLTAWAPIHLRFRLAAADGWAAGNGLGWNDLDSLDVGCGAMDGLTDAERQTAMTLWAISGTPLYSGDDLTRLDATGLRLLTNDEVIAVQQSGRIASPVGPLGTQQVWRAAMPDGSLVIALFNLDDHAAAPITATWADLGLAGPATVRDLWLHQDLGIASGAFSAVLPPHACRLLRIRLVHFNSSLKSTTPQ